MSIPNGIVSTKIYYNRNDFHFEKVNSTFLDGDVPHLLSSGVHISQLIQLARVWDTTTLEIKLFLNSAADS